MQQNRETEAPEPTGADFAETKRIRVVIENGTLAIGSDAHVTPGRPVSTAMRGFVHVIQALQPKLVCLNGDLLDCASISRFPKSGWQRRLTLKEELAEGQARMRDIARAAPDAERIYTRGNHDGGRWDSWLSNKVPEFDGVAPTFASHFPDWRHCVSLQINHDTVVKHRWHGGTGAARNNTLKSGQSLITGHSHRLGVVSFTDWNGTRYGVESGTLADPASDLFDYAEDNPTDWQPGFVILHFVAGRLMLPQIVPVILESEKAGEGQIYWAGRVVWV
jgi:hypothetical protein